MATPLKYGLYGEYLIKEVNEGERKRQYVFRFPNNYGDSIIKNIGSYGYEGDLFELAVLYFEGDKFEIAYNTPIAQDVVGFLSNDDVLNLLEDIKKLKGGSIDE